MSNVVTIGQAVQQLKQGQVIAYPTEAVWGLGCDPYQEIAFQQLLHLKQRPPEKGVILLTDQIARVLPLLEQLSIEQRNRVISSWTHVDAQRPATTWLLPLHPMLPHWISGQHQQIAVRVSQHAVCQALCKAFDGFIVSTSANPAGLAPAQCADQVQHYFGNDIAIVAGQVGQHPRPSQIIDAVSGRIIRH